jgi:phage gp36-like protein
MAYAAQSDLVPLRLTMPELIQLTDDNHTGQVNTAVVNTALEEASGTVDSYCRKRYVTPLQADDDVKRLTVDLTLWALFSRRRGVKVSETVQQRYDAAMAFLKDISNGKASLDQPVGDLPQQSTGGPVIAQPHSIPQDRSLRFKDEDLKGFV